MENILKLLNISPLGATILTNGETSPFFINAALLQTLGYQVHNLPQSDYHRLFPHNFFLKLQESFSVPTKDGKRSLNEVKFKTKDGEFVFFTISSDFVTINQEQAIVSFYKDVTEKIQTQSLLARSERSLRDAQKVARLGNWEWNPPAEPYYSEELLNIYGFTSSKEFTFEAFRSLLHPTDRDRVYETINNAFLYYTPYDIEYRIVMSSGQLKYVHSRAESFLDTEGNKKMVGTVQDITMQVNNRQMLERSEHGLKDAQRLAKVGNWEWDIIGDQRYYSDELLHIYGLSSTDEFTFNIFIDLLHPEDKHRVSSIVDKALLSYEPYNIHFRILLPGGEVKYLHGISKVYHDRQGKLIKMLGTVQDISQQVLAKLALEKSEKRLNRAQQIGKTGYWEWDIKKEEVYWSDELYVLYDRPKGEFIPTVGSVVELIYEADRQQVNEYICHSLLTKQAYYELEARIPTKTGIDKYFIAKAEIIYDQAGNPVRMEGISQDITHIKKAEEDLKFKDYLLQNVNDAIVSADKHLDITSWNKAAETIYGYTEQEALGKNLPQLLCFNPPDSDSEAHQKFLDKGYFKGNLTMKRKDGSDVIIEAHTIPLKDEKGNLIGRVSVDRDITAYSYMQHKAEESEHMLKLVLHTVPQAIFWKDVHSVFRGCNESFIKMVGLADASEVIGKRDEEMFWGVSRGRDIQHQDEQIINGNIPGLFYTKLFQRKDGSFIWLDIIRIPMYNTEKQIIGVLGSLEDITEKRQTEQALTNSRSNLQAIIENTDDLIWSVDLEMRIISMNSKLSHYSDLHFDKPLKAGDNFAEALPEQFKKRLQKVVRKVIKGEKMYFSKRYTLNNNYYWYDISVYPIVEADGQIRGISFMVRDATERKKQEKLILKFVKQHSQLKLQQEKLKMLAVVQGQEEERRLISMELHDGVGQMLTALNFKMNKLSDKILPIATADISLSLDEIGRLQKSIYQEVRRISENLMPQFLNDFPLEKALEQLIIQTFGGTGIVVNSVCKRDHHTFDKGLEIAIFRITQEIFNNIHKHSQATKVYVTLQLKKTLIYLLVKDNGIGFDKSAGNQKMGKGLNNISQRVSLLNGSSFVASHPGKGCQLQIKIPVNSYEKS